jgi:hypothetical protein
MKPENQYWMSKFIYKFVFNVSKQDKNDVKIIYFSNIFISTAMPLVAPS